MTTASSVWSQLLLLSCCVVVLLLAFPAPVQSATKNAYVCIHYEGTPKDDEYVLGTRVLLKSLKMSGTKQDIIVLVAPNVRHETREQFRQDGAIVQEVKNIPNPWKVRQVADHEGGGTYRSRFEFTLNKIHLWNLTQYERVVYLDADNIVLSNLDELFYCAHFCAVFMNPCNFHTGLLVVRPDTKMFNKILTTLEKENPRSYDGADQGFFTYFFNFERIGGARMFDPYDGKTEPAEDEMMRLPPGYNLNALWFYEKGDWHLYRCHSRFMNLTVPGVSLTFPTPPWLKPWYWWPYLLLDSNWFLWQSFRAQLGESFTSVVIGTLAVLLALVVSTAWGLPFASSSPRILSILDKYFNRPLNFAVSLMGDNITGILMGLVCAFLVNLLPWYFLPGILPPDIGWFLYAVSEQSLNFIFLTVLSFIIVKRNRALGVDVLMKQSVRSMIPSVLLMIALFLVCRFKLYPAGLPFHTGKILSVFSIALVFLLCQIASYRKLVVEKNPQALILSNHH